MQIDELIFYNHDGETRTIALRSGAMNVITGDSRTGKSSLINIVRFLLGSGSPHVPYGPIQQSIAWYAMRAHIGDTQFFIAREAPATDAESNDVMLVIGPESAPAMTDLRHNTSVDGLRDYLGGLLGVEDNRNVPNIGQTRHALSASFVHALIYCFQGQGEIANPDILFHRQNREWMPQTIRDTLPYFLGAQGADDLRRREELADRRRELRRLTQRLRAAEAERAAGLDRAGSLLSEAVDVDLLAERPESVTLAEARDVLRRVLDNPAAVAQSVAAGGEFDRLNARRRELTAGVRDLGEQLRGLERFADADRGQVGELAEQNARLASIGLIPEEMHEDAHCALCDQPLGEAPNAPARAALARSLGRAEQRLQLARRDTPRIEEARARLLEEQRARRNEIREIDESLSAIASRDELALRTRDAINLQSYVRGRIAQYLDSTQDVGDVELEHLRTEVARVGALVQTLSDGLDANAVRSRTTSLLRGVSSQMTTWAQDLELEHSEASVQIDIDKLTIVADTPQGPAYMDRGEIGSGMNWVGYHLTAYLALQQFFINNKRPVPSFLILDQPSQAFFPRDRESGGDLELLSDTDRENTRRLYELVHRVVAELGGRLQVIALDHADFEDEWFAESVVQRWRGGEALIPLAWIARDAEDDPADRND